MANWSIKGQSNCCRLLEWVSLKSLICPFHHANGRSHHPIIAPQLSEVKQMQFVWGCAASKSGLTAPPRTSKQIISLSITTLYKQPCEPCSINHLLTHWHSRHKYSLLSLLRSNILTLAAHYYGNKIWCKLLGRHKITLLIWEVCYSIQMSSIWINIPCAQWQFTLITAWNDQLYKIKSFSAQYFLQERSTINCVAIILS